MRINSKSLQNIHHNQAFVFKKSIKMRTYDQRLINVIVGWCSNFFALTRVGFRSLDHFLTIWNTTTVNLDNGKRSLIVSSSFTTQFLASKALFVLGTFSSDFSYQPFHYRYHFHYPKYIVLYVVLGSSVLINYQERIPSNWSFLIVFIFFCVDAIYPIRGQEIS